MEQCNNCIFYKSYGDSGECRRYPPQRHTAQAQLHSGEKYLDSRSNFPNVSPAEWCGEFREK